MRRRWRRIDAAKLAALFQASAGNPLVGLEGRAALLRRLGRALTERSEIFGALARPGALFDTLTHGGQRKTIAASALLRALLDGLGAIWLTGSTLDGVPLGDVWQHPHAGGSGPTAGWVPFHKLSQWLAYSLFEPFEWARRRRSPAAMRSPGLPEYRNGGLLLDTGVLALRNDADALVACGRRQRTRRRVARADGGAARRACAARARDASACPTLPLACILEGGTWAAGRELATALRGGDPPLAIRSDGTVF